MIRIACPLPLVLSLVVAAGTVQAQTVEFARATLAGAGASGGSGVAASNWFYSGWRFEVTNGPLHTTDIGGHFSAGFGSTLFGALVRLTGPNDDPDTFTLTSPDVIATTVFPVPGNVSAEVSAPFDVRLDNGWYVVLFGGGAFGASEFGGGLQGQPADSAIPGAQNIITYRQPSHPAGQGGPFLQGTVCRVFVHAVPESTCAADFNDDGVVDFFDYLDFVNALATLDPSADFNDDGSIDFFDYLDFVQAFSDGC